jgi:cytochrome c oxidase assembly factor CtaG/cytochrome c2
MTMAHAGAHGLWWSAVTRWTWEPVTIVLLALSMAWYAIGLRSLWRRAGTGRGVRRWEASAFALGLLTLALALLSPLAWLSERLFSAHMTQHEILMLVAAPLLVFGRPLQVFLWAFAPVRRERIGAWTRGPIVASTWHAVTGPVAVFALHAVAIWLWHVPFLYEAALADPAVHALQHVSFVVTAALFWWGMVNGRYGRIGYGAAVLYIFLTAIHTSVLGALLTIAPSLWYPSYAAAAGTWQLNALADQQLAGLIMWVPSGVIFIVFGLGLLAGWLGESERRARLGSVPLADTTRSSPRFPAALLIIALGLTSGCTTSKAAEDARELTGGEPRRGVEAINRYGCGSCHEIPGIHDATGTIGPPLTRIARRAYLGGHVSNTPADMIRWIQHPQKIDPGTAMPDMGVTDSDAKDIAAYLYTLR